jgi:hypothetical protein
MLGRSCRSRGVCDGVLYINTGEDEAQFWKRIKVADFSKALNYISLLKEIRDLSKTNPKKDQKG